MTVKVSDVMRHCRNHFITGALTGQWRQEGGVLTPANHFAAGMWIAVTGPDSPGGVYQLDEQGGVPGLADVQWSGTIYKLNPPADFIRLCEAIGSWAAANPDPAVSGEKLGEYSISRRAGSWESVFAAALAPFRRMFPEVTA